MRVDADKQQLEYYKHLHDLKVNLDTYTRSLSRRPEKVTRIVAESNAANLHLHHSWAAWLKRYFKSNCKGCSASLRTYIVILLTTKTSKINNTIKNNYCLALFV